VFSMIAFGGGEGGGYESGGKCPFVARANVRLSVGGRLGSSGQNWGRVERAGASGGGRRVLIEDRAHVAPPRHVPSPYPSHHSRRLVSTGPVCKTKTKIAVLEVDTDVKGETLIGHHRVVASTQLAKYQYKYQYLGIKYQYQYLKSISCFY